MVVKICRVVSANEDPVLFEALVHSCRRDSAERDPGDPLLGPAEIEAEFFRATPGRTAMVFVALDGDRPVGHAHLTTMADPTIEVQVCEIEILIPVEHRRRGIGDAFMDHLIPEVVGLGQQSVIGYVATDIWEGSSLFCERYGMTSRVEERCSRVSIKNIDEVMIDEWLAEGPAKAPGYRLERWQGPCPDEFLEPWVNACAAMADQPFGDLDYEHQVKDLGQQAEADAALAAAGFVFYRSLALAEDGEGAGMSMIYLHPERPQLAQQGDTGVCAPHRGHGLGRWLKAANYRQARLAHPDLATIETYNANSNSWMLDINVAMGFRPHHGYAAYQASVEEIQAAMATR